MKLAFDTGGTFTDFAMADDKGNILLHKVLSTPDDPARAVLQGIDELLVRVSGGGRGNGAPQVLGATTVVTNAVLERKGVETAFITTDGFQDMLRIRTEGRYDLYDLNIQYPEPLVSRDLCFGADERVTADGVIVRSLNELQVQDIAIQLRDAGIRSVAVCLLHAYKYPGHEQRVLELFNSVAPEIAVSLSSSVCPEVREFDRASTTVANAYTQPLMVRHVDHLERELSKRGIERQLLWMTSSGGVVPSSTAARVPVRLIESGPAAGAVAASDYARTAGEESVLSFDMGGTTAKLCLIPNGQPMIANELEVARYERFRKGSGFPLKIQSIHMIEIGAGGGSIASRSQLGLLAVGPRSAGAAPGPACYGRGGTEPTVTDADLLLGYVDEHSFLGGDFALDRAAAKAAMSHLADRLEISADRCAWGIHDMVNESMSKAAAMQATESGVDPRALPLIAFGGAGPVHAYGVARKLGIGKVICPLGAGVTSAIGLLGAPVASDLSASRPLALASWDPALIHAVLDPLVEQGREVVLASGVASADITATFTVDMRHVGQGHEISVGLPERDLASDGFVEELLARFYAAYESLYGRTVAGSPVEVITWRVRVSGPRSHVTAGRIGGTGAATKDPLKGTRSVFFDELGTYVDTPVYDHYALTQDRQIQGPAIIEQRESTVVVGPSATASVDAQQNLIMLLA
ncbi:hydantoinase/oxoprolinase family protein [Burkholderia gladioli pv. gladioli]|uniref:Hydantoinase/oxoprolinase family protein n=1 Tax=Burkholderia gladioli TaxID=28095 RepID=A0A095HCR9_BURGA|nr:hydantoinase/oxoprolinase family protein [Burkholderia gladioli]AJW99227.1 hydantoinase/oxoprolinase family protein [Burkholderia gladioli]ASD79923.1 methylhydantoinase [Burkholderia gladioli pv. gladioli]AWY54835.1 methylhydantoinase [Burkholderia gladioli pv. gladioli]KGC11384.1 hydantoinase/oxoprolinase family protein [Burkholderia gladioli]MDJ1164164.1 hydantoinase/oxoprolinase family protein [Burkholderia gladioli pv. gladioli]